MPLRPIIAVVLLLLVGYGITRAWPLVSGPKIVIESPISFSSGESGVVTISGRALRTETLWLDGAPLLIDEEGRFKAALVLPSGGGILSLTATDRFGREVTERRSIFIP